MWNGLPEIAPGSNRDAKDKQKKNKETSPKLNYKGITLKEYFRICEQNRHTNVLKQIKEESRASSRASKAETPSFNQQEQQLQVRSKFKTETCCTQNENNFKINTLKSGQSKGNMHSLQKGQKGTYTVKKNEDRKKIFSKMHSHSIKEQNNSMSRSTINSFYQIEQNKKKMLKKLQQQKNRSNQLRLSEAFFITKYGSKFKIGCKAVNQE